MRNLFSLMIISATFPLLITGCGGTPTMHYYQLTPTTLSVASEAEKLPNLALGIGPITIPEMLKRQEIVTRGEDNQFRLANLHRWAGLLEKDITMVISENMGRQLGTDQVLSFPWPAYFNPDYRVVIEIMELTGNPENIVTLRAGWSIIDKSDKQMLSRKISEYKQVAAEQSINAMVDAQNQVIAMLCQEISDSLRQRKSL